MSTEQEQVIRSVEFHREQIFCRCPKCDQKALISNTSARVRVSCLSCTYQKDQSPDKLYNPVVGVARRPCPTCGYQWLTAEVSAKNNHRLRQTMTVDCPACQQSAVLNLTWKNDLSDRYSNSPTAPFFGLPLWLQIDCCDHTLWAYNEKHIASLRAFIESKNRGEWPMKSRLPTWMIIAKNRDIVLKCLTKLDQMLRET
jgi:hypothetical protein